MFMLDGGVIKLECDDCGAVVIAIDLATPIPGFPIPMAAVRPLIAQAVEAVLPEFEGCAILCPVCAPIRKINVQPSTN